MRNLKQTASKNNLSVSTIGTNELQRVETHSRICLGHSLSVSTIGTNELQLPPCSRSPRARALSVSTIGTNELQPRARHDRALLKRLSVSTIGTNELQLEQEQMRHTEIMNFQFPQSERMSCNFSSPSNAVTISRSFSFHNRNE